MWGGVEALLGRLARVLEIAAMVTIAAMAVHVFLAVASRGILGFAFAGTLEIVANYFMVILCILPLVAVARAEAHISAELFTRFFPPYVRRFLDVLTLYAFAAFLGLLAWQTFDDALAKMAQNDAAFSGLGDIPIWPARFVLPLGFGVAALHAFAVGLKRGAVR